MYKALCSLILVLLIFSFVSCTNSKNEYGKEQFYLKLQELGYDTSGKEEIDGTVFNKKGERITSIVNEGISVYEFGSQKDADNNAQHIEKDGSGTTKSGINALIDWVASPHFYKKGKVVVQYIGENIKIIRDLQSLLGEEFAGEDWHYNEYTFETLPTVTTVREHTGVIDIHGKIENIEVLDRFVDNFSKNRTDKVTVLKYTIEGDPIIYQLIYDGEKIIYYSDTRQDKFGEKSVTKKELQSISKSGKDYILTGESIETENYEFVFLRVN